jgi:hypothetical protein
MSLWEELVHFAGGEPDLMPVKWVSRRVTGHSAHGLNALFAAWLISLFGVSLPVAIILPVVFYLIREYPWRSDDSVGDMAYVNAVAFSLWVANPWPGIALGVAAVGYDIWYWTSRPAPGWMPRDWTLLWGK